jgi:hypothetical protein
MIKVEKRIKVDSHTNSQGKEITTIFLFGIPVYRRYILFYTKD